ncbi:MAG: alpha/beta fold hydrolase [Proteobacteria bacterium]|nr:alpha/beta fold hydrolase [Pseudomonadota bacterium]
MTAPTALLMLPGLLCDAALWEAPIAGLAELARPIVADLTRDDSITAMAQRTLAEAPDKFMLAGFSMGGYVAQEIMRQAPERVLRLALIDTSSRPDTQEQHQRRQALIKLATSGRFRGVTPQLLPFLIHPKRMEDAALAQTVMDMAERVGRDAFLRQQTAIMNRPDGRADLVRIHAHTLVLCGAEDAITPVELHREMAAGIADSRLIVVADSGHLSPLEQKEPVVAALRRWLTDEP